MIIYGLPSKGKLYHHRMRAKCFLHRAYLEQRIVLSWRNPRSGDGYGVAKLGNVTSVCVCAHFVPDATLKKARFFSSISFQVAFSRVFGCFWNLLLLFLARFHEMYKSNDLPQSASKSIAILLFREHHFSFTELSELGTIGLARILLDLKSSSWSIVMRTPPKTFRFMDRSLC